VLLTCGPEGEWDVEVGFLQLEKKKMCLGACSERIAVIPFAPALRKVASD